MEDALQTVGQTMALLGSLDKRLLTPKQLDPRLASQLKGYARRDPPPQRVKPVPLSLLISLYQSAHASQNPSRLAVADMALIGFFFLCRPGEYTAPLTSDSYTTPFCLCNVTLFHGQTRLHQFTTPANILQSATHASLTFTKQKTALPTKPSLSVVRAT